MITAALISNRKKIGGNINPVNRGPAGGCQYFGAVQLMAMWRRNTSSPSTIFRRRWNKFL